MMAPLLTAQPLAALICLLAASGLTTRELAAYLTLVHEKEPS